ncbi:MAG: Glu/Leu/Phe/Val dehydrogenase [Bdellovibrionales bacterium]|nr:Glu/Leu/Phe/Val dehydrogenase [Bdellovibrionales bacterium]
MSFELISKYGEHEQVVYCRDERCGLKAIIAIHNTTLGPALGGTRMWNYASDEEALIDVLRLSKGMTYKAAAAGLNLGGGKAVIIGDPKKQKTESLFRTFGAFVNSLKGKYVTAEDVGTSVRDMEYVYMETPYVTGIPVALGGSGDPSPYTAHGVLMGIKATVKKKLGADSLSGVRFSVQGLGNVGRNLTKYLTQEGAEVVATDIDPEVCKRASEEFGVQIVAPDQILQQEVDVFAPCALGAVVNDQTIDQLNCKAVAGGANNVLSEEKHGRALMELGILYAPDYVINAGGLMNVFVELEGYTEQRAVEKTNKVYDNLMTVFDIAESKGVPTFEAANLLAEQRIAEIAHLRSRAHGREARQYSTLDQMTKRHD